jgi:glucose-6-phosphate dehydrogenase assembly protein OpcA
LDDAMIRRRGWHYYHPHAVGIAEQTAGWMAESLGWDRLRRQTELAQYRELRQRQF